MTSTPNLLYMDRYELNELKSKVINSWRYLNKVFDGGIETYDQFQTFVNMCENYLGLCNGWCKQVKPRLGWIQYKQMCLYKDLYETCEFVVYSINNIISSWQTAYDDALEESKQKDLYEEKLRFEHQLAMEFRDIQYEHDKECSQKAPIGFKIPTTPKKKGRKKKTE